MHVGPHRSGRDVAPKAWMHMLKGGGQEHTGWCWCCGQVCRTPAHHWHAGKHTAAAASWCCWQARRLACTPACLLLQCLARTPAVSGGAGGMAGIGYIGMGAAVTLTWCGRGIGGCLGTCGAGALTRGRQATAQHTSGHARLMHNCLCPQCWGVRPSVPGAALGAPACTHQHCHACAPQAAAQEHNCNDKQRKHR